MDDLPRIAALQHERNIQTAAGWESFAGHRRRVTELLLPDRQNAANSLCVFGAGNCNDLDLHSLLASYRQLHLVDIDLPAMQGGLSRQGLAEHDRIRLYPHIDLSAADLWWGQLATTSSTNWNQLIASTTIAGLPPTCDRAVSLCTLTQILELAVRRLGEQHERYVELVRALRRRHLHLLLDQLVDGGTGILVTDLVSSRSCPQLADTSAESLPPLVRSLIEQRNFFSGVNPAVFHALLTSDQEFAPQISSVEMISPWLWDLGPRIYAVYAARFRKQSPRSR